MNAGGISEASLDRALDALSTAERAPHFPVEPDLTVIIGELQSWLEDDRQWLAAYARQWSSLLADVDAARRAVGQELAQHLDGSQAGWREIAACQKDLKGQNGKKIFDPALRRRLQRAVAPIATSLREPDALGAIWDDLIASSDHAVARREARRLALFIQAQGHDPKRLLRQLEDILRDDKFAVDLARGGHPGSEAHGKRAGFDEVERVALARDALNAPPRRADAVVWLSYSLAPLGRDTLRLGDAVSLFRASWLRSVFAGEIDAELPPEAQKLDEYSHLPMLAGAPPDDKDKKDEEEIPHVLVRVDLGTVATAESLALARETAELIVSLATLVGTDPAIWILTESHVTYYDGKESAASFHAPPVFQPNLDQQSALQADPMPEVVSEWAADLAPQLPLVREDLRQAAKLALWMRRSRETWEPGRIVLADRVFEQVAGWAGVTDRDRFVRQHLRLSWAFRRVRLEISNCWRAVYASRLNRDQAFSERAWEEIEDDPALEFEERMGGGWSVNLAGVLLRLDFLIENVAEGTLVHERLSRLKGRTASGRAAFQWVNDLLADFDTLEPRARRVRNATVHGGPVSDEMADAVIDFVEWLASDALQAAIRGLLSDGSLVDWFLNRREVFENLHERLRRNEAPFGALFWGDSGIT